MYDIVNTDYLPLVPLFMTSLSCATAHLGTAHWGTAHWETAHWEEDHDEETRTKPQINPKGIFN